MTKRTASDMLQNLKNDSIKIRIHQTKEKTTISPSKSLTSPQRQSSSPGRPVTNVVVAKRLIGNHLGIPELQKARDPSISPSKREKAELSTKSDETEEENITRGDKDK